MIAARQAEIADGGAAVPRRSWPKERQLPAGAVRNRCSSRSRFASFRLSSCQASAGRTRYFRFSNAYTDIVRCFPRALEASLTDD